MLSGSEQKALYYLRWSNKALEEASEGINAITTESRRREYILNVVPKCVYYGIKPYSIQYSLDTVSGADRFEQMERLVDIIGLLTPR